MNEVLMGEVWIYQTAFIATFLVITALIHHFFSRCLGNRFNKPIYYVIAYVLYYAISSLLYLTPMYGYSMLLINLLLIFGLSFLYKKNIAWRIGATALITVLIILSDAIAQLALNVFITGDDTFIYLFSLVLGKLLLLVFEGIALKAFVSYGEARLSVSYWVLMVFCPVLTGFGIYGLWQQPAIRETPLLMLSIVLGFTFLNFFVFMFCDHILYKQAIDRRSLLLEQQIELYKNQYQAAEQTQKKSMQFRHDLKNILLGLRSEIDAGKISESKSTLDMLIDDFGSVKGIVRSGNLVVDSIINYKEQTAAVFGTPFRLDLRFPADIIIDTTAVSVILGNALDNAIEASKQVESDKRYITIQIHYENESLFIRVENPFVGNIQTDRKGKIVTTKPDKKKHGAGLSSIEDMITGKQTGLLNISFENAVFQIEVALFNIKRGNSDL